MTVRSVILIILLIGAAFLGGVCVSGPRLRWIQACVLRSLSLHEGGEIPAVDLESNLSAENVSAHRIVGGKGKRSNGPHHAGI